jgi:lipid-binding SYLF domain-containing protein
MNRCLKPLLAGLLLALVAAPLHARGPQEMRTVQTATVVLRVMNASRQRDIPPELVRTAAAVAVIPRILHGGLVVGGRFGRGLVVARRPDGTWDDPVFVTLSGGSVGGLAGIETGDLVVVFRTKEALERVLEGSYSLGGDATVAVGPFARLAESELPGGWPRSEVLCYPQSRGGLFAGLSLEGAWLRVDDRGNTAFTGRRSEEQTTALDLLKLELAKMTLPPIAPVTPAPPVPKRR